MAVAKKTTQAKTKANIRPVTKRATGSKNASIKPAAKKPIVPDGGSKKALSETLQKIPPLDLKDKKATAPFALESGQQGFAIPSSRLRPNNSLPIDQLPAIIKDKNGQWIHKDLDLDALRLVCFFMGENITGLNAWVREIATQEHQEHFASYLIVLYQLGQEFIKEAGGEIIKRLRFDLLEAKFDEFYQKKFFYEQNKQIAPLLDKANAFIRKKNTERDDYIRQLKKQYLGVLTHEAIFKKADKEIIGDLKFGRFKNIK